MSVARVALTGGIATGKSYVLGRFASRNVPTIDADLIAHDVMRAGQPAAEEIRRRFGDDVFDADQEIDRQRLAARVFDDAAERKTLEAIVHPLVREAINQWFKQVEGEDRSPFAIADIPLLFETGRQQGFDRIVVTSCPLGVQLNRLLARSMTENDARKRIAAQLPTGEKVSGADFTILTDGSFEDTDRKIEAVYTALGGLGARQARRPRP